MIVDDLRRDGFYRSPVLWEGAAAMTEHLRRQPAYPAHIVAFGDRQARTLDEVLAMPLDGPGIPHQWDFACHSMEATLSAPGFLDFALSFARDAREYFDGEEPLLYSVNSFWKKPLGQPGWHYDIDDRKIFCVFLYGTDILAEADGPHEYARGTHRWSFDEKKPYYNTNLAAPADLIDSIYGPAGTWIVTDTCGLHNGACPQPPAPPRLLTWIRFGVTDPPPSYRIDELRPVPASRLGRKPDGRERLTHLVIDWSA